MSTVHIINFRNMFIHESVNHSEKEYANGIVHVNNYVNAEVTCIKYGLESSWV